jgi:hypothetical protein
MPFPKLKALVNYFFQDCDIIVFPEYGLTGSGMSNLPLEEFEEYCQTIPSEDFDVKNVEDMVSYSLIMIYSFN